MPHGFIERFQMFLDMAPGFSLVEFFQFEMKYVSRQVFEKEVLVAVLQKHVEIFDQCLFAGDRARLCTDDQILCSECIAGDQLCE